MNQQRQLFAANHQAPETRAAAFENAERPRAGGSIGRSRREAIREFLRERGRRGATDHETAQALNIVLDSAKAARFGLVEAGEVVDSGQRRPTPTGAKAAVWILASLLPKMDADISREMNSGKGGPSKTGSGAEGTAAAAVEADDWKELRRRVEALKPNELKFFYERVDARRAAGENPDGLAWRALVDVRRRFGHWGPRPAANAEAVTPQHQASPEQLADARVTVAAALRAAWNPQDEAAGSDGPSNKPQPPDPRTITGSDHGQQPPVTGDTSC